MCVGTCAVDGVTSRPRLDLERVRVHLADEEKLRPEAEDEVGIAGARAPDWGDAMTCVHAERGPPIRAAPPGAAFRG